MTPLKPNDAITAAFNLLPVKMAGKEARLMLLAIQLQDFFSALGFNRDKRHRVFSTVAE